MNKNKILHIKSQMILKIMTQAEIIITLIIHHLRKGNISEISGGK